MGVPKRRQREPRRFDTTSCRQATYRDFVHRDYFAHCMRWSWVGKFLEPGQRVLDVGCGVEAQLARVLSGEPFAFGAKQFGSQYVGVDFNRLRQQQKPWATFHGEFDFTSRYAELGLASFDAVVNLEVIEHMAPEDGLRLLAAMRDALKPDGRIYLSTPVFNGRAAANHVHEYTVPELRAAIESVGLSVRQRFGTFASYHDLKRALTPEHRAVYEQLRGFHGDDVMACFLTPLYPDAARNCFWVLSHPEVA